MADFSTTHSPPTRRRMPPTGLGETVTGTILRLGERKQELANRAQEYDRALRQSQHAAATRRRHGSGSVLLGSATQGDGGASSSIWQSGDVGTMAMAQTVALGDSHGSVAPPPPNEPAHDQADDDAEVGSELGDSYVDGKRFKGFTSPQDEGDEEDGLEDGGVLGLLAQIYGTKGQGPARVI